MFKINDVLESKKVQALSDFHGGKTDKGADD